MTALTSTPTDEDVLRDCLGRAAPDVFGGPSGIAAVERSRFRLATSYDAYVLAVRLAGGGEVKAFLKDFGVSARGKDGRKDRREREVRVYREVLADAGLGTPRYYGSVLDEAQGRLWLLLEFVDGTPVQYCDIAGHWAPAAAGLARVHGAFAGQAGRLAGWDFLVRHDADFFRARADLALRNAEQASAALGGRLAAVLRRLDPVVGVLTDQPRTLVHGGCRAVNILVRVRPDPARVCVLDWEEAGWGAPVYDLAYLLDGIEPPALDPLLEAYRREARAYGLPLPADRDMKHVIDCFRLQMTLNMLGQAGVKGYTEAGVAKLVGIAERLTEVVSRPAR